MGVGRVELQHFGLCPSEEGPPASRSQDEGQAGYLAGSAEQGKACGSGALLRPPPCWASAPFRLSGTC